MDLNNIDDAQQRTDASGPSPWAAAPVKIPRRAMARRCSCGRCTCCLDNARWERIFQEKFADQTYYTRSLVTRGSALSGFERI